MVIARAVVVDLATGVHLVAVIERGRRRRRDRPVVGPLMGGLILLMWPWRVSFLALAVFAAAMTVAVRSLSPRPFRRNVGMPAGWGSSCTPHVRCWGNPGSWRTWS